MSLAKRLGAIERRIRELEAWKQDVEQAIAAEEAAEAEEDDPGVTLDGDANGRERDQSASLG